MGNCVVLTLLPLLLLIRCGLAADKNWHYGHYESSAYGPSMWKKEFPTCGGKSQSPIAFYLDDVYVDSKLAPLNLTGYSKTIPVGILELENSGHALEVKVPDKVDIQISGGNLPDIYNLAQLHFHWGKTDNVGSEHYVGNKAYPLIVHLVHVRKGKRLGQILNNKGDLAVIGIGFKLTDTPHSEMEKFVKHTREVSFAGETKPLSEAITVSKFLPKDYSNFFRYDGSLTTPPCWESVIWTFLVDTVPISRGQLNRLRDLFGTPRGHAQPEHIHANFRPLQPVNGRSIRLRKPVDLPEKPADYLKPKPTRKNEKGRAPTKVGKKYDSGAEGGMRPVRFLYVAPCLVFLSAFFRHL